LKRKKKKEKEKKKKKEKKEKEKKERKRKEKLVVPHVLLPLILNILYWTHHWRIIKKLELSITYCVLMSEILSHSHHWLIAETAIHVYFYFLYVFNLKNAISFIGQMYIFHAYMYLWNAVFHSCLCQKIFSHSHHWLIAETAFDLLSICNLLVYWTNVCLSCIYVPLKCCANLNTLEQPRRCW